MMKIVILAILLNIFISDACSEEIESGIKKITLVEAKKLGISLFRQDRGNIVVLKFIIDHSFPCPIQSVRATISKDGHLISSFHIRPIENSYSATFGKEFIGYTSYTFICSQQTESKISQFRLTGME